MPPIDSIEPSIAVSAVTDNFPITFPCKSCKILDKKLDQLINYFLIKQGLQKLIKNSIKDWIKKENTFNVALVPQTSKIASSSHVLCFLLDFFPIRTLKIVLK